ncbi:MAG: hypothetical protein WBA77_13030 [Microcoleaceae cyanobacterium]
MYLLGYSFQPISKNIRDSSYSAIEDKQILSILGCPITRKIVDTEEHVILNVGDLITAESVIQAKQAGNLEMLLNSVYS